MHLLLAQRGTIADEGEAIDLDQPPGDICVLSAADTELAALAAAQDLLPEDAPSLRLVNVMRLSHNVSVDQWIERTGRHSRIVVLRALGGLGYFRYAIEALSAAARRHGFDFVALPGDATPDPELSAFSTLPIERAEALWSYLVAGGTENAGRFLQCCAASLGLAAKPAEAEPIPQAGHWSPERFPMPARTEAAEAGAIAVVFYRALVLGGDTGSVSALCEAIEERGLRPVPIFVASLKNAECAAFVREAIASASARVVVNLTGFAVSSPGADHKPTPLDEGGAVVLQAVLAGQTEEAWTDDTRGLTARDLAMNVALPEIDGRVLSRAIAFKRAANWHDRTQCDLVRSAPRPDRVGFVAELARRWASIPREPAQRRVSVVLANYPTRDGRIGNGVGLDTPAGTIELLRALEEAGYATEDLPTNGDALLDRLLEGPTNRRGTRTAGRVHLSLPAYRRSFAALPAAVRERVTERWGDPESDPSFVPDENGFALAVVEFGSVAVGIQPSRGYGVDPKETYHSPDLVPPHGYVAFYAWMREAFAAHAVVHMGKHGNMEWLPGKALALSGECFPEAVFGPMPHVYPFIVNDPGEGSQAKRRAQAVIVDHLTPPLTRAEAHGPMRELEALVDEYYEASSGDSRRARILRGEIMALAGDSGLARDIGIEPDAGTDDALERLDAWLCELKEMQIRDGLHVFGRSPEGRLRTDLVCALARSPAEGRPGLTQALAQDLALAFDPLDCILSEPWQGPRPDELLGCSAARWRSAGDTVERLELLAARLVDGAEIPRANWTGTREVLAAIEAGLCPALDVSGTREISAVLQALSGRFVEPGPSGAPTRGRLDVLPTGRNFYSVDTRSVPTPTSWELGRKSAELVLVRHLQDHGDWPRAVGLTCWGTANMRTGGDDIAQALALIGAKPVWDGSSRRVTGFEVITLAELGRPRVDVTLRISGFFRDAFPDQIALFDRAARAVAALDEPAEDNPVSARFRQERATLVAGGIPDREADRRAGYRVFGSKPEAYGAGLQALIDERGWSDRGDLAEAYTVWGSYAYGAKEEGVADRSAFETRLGLLEAVLHNQDNREHDLLDSDDYYQFEGGMFAAVERLRGNAPAAYHNDHSRPEKPVVRSLDEELARVVRGRVTNPKWIAGVMRHGYKGAFEIAATVDYLFAFAATTGLVRDAHFDAVHTAFIADDEVREWMGDKNPNAQREMAETMLDGIERGLWSPRSNSARFEIESLAKES